MEVSTPQDELRQRMLWNFCRLAFLSRLNHEYNSDFQS